MTLSITSRGSGGPNGGSYKRRLHQRSPRVPVCNHWHFTKFSLASLKKFMYHFKILSNLHDETNMLLPKMGLFPRKKQRKLTEHFQLCQSENFFKKNWVFQRKICFGVGWFFSEWWSVFPSLIFFKNCKIRRFYLHKTAGQLFFVLPSQKIHLGRGSD